MAALPSPSVQDGPRQPKRQRTDAGREGGFDVEPKPSRSKTIWMSDGNIVLQTGDGTQFRVHKSVLAMHSPFFRDMFGVVDEAQMIVEEKEEQIDGCAVIHMSKDDRADDWERILQQVYHLVPLTATASSVPDLATINRTLVFTNKYQFDGLFKEALNTLSAGFPNDLDTFTRRYTLHLDGLDVCYEMPCFWTCKTWACQTDALLAVIHTALRLGGDCRKILPVAMYLASIVLDFSDIRNDERLADRNVQDRLINAREAMRLDLCTKWHPWLFDLNQSPVIPIEGCTNRNLCENIRANTDMRFLRRIPSSSGQLFLHALKELRLERLLLGLHVNSRMGLCAVCLQGFVDHYKACRVLMFDALPQYFGLGTWKELLKEGDSQG